MRASCRLGVERLLYNSLNIIRRRSLFSYATHAPSLIGVAYLHNVVVGRLIELSGPGKILVAAQGGAAEDWHQTFPPLNDHYWLARGLALGFTPQSLVDILASGLAGGSADKVVA